MITSLRLVIPPKMKNSANTNTRNCGACHGDATGNRIQPRGGRGGTPKPIIDRYHREITGILALPEVKRKLEEMEFDVVATTPDEFHAWIAAEIPRWGKVIRDTGTKAN